LKVAVVHNQVIGTREAGIAFVTGAAVGYAQAGAEVAVLTPGDGREPTNALRRLDVPMPAPFQIRQMPLTKWRVGPFRPSWSRLFHRAVLREIDAGKYDVAVVRDLKLADFLVRARPRAKIVYELHNIYSIGEDDTQAAALFPAKKLKMHRARQLREQRILARVDGVIALTGGLAAILEEKTDLGGRIGVGPSALHPAALPPRNMHRTDIAYIGSLDVHKGVGLLVRALRELPEDVHLMIMGHGRHYEPLEALAKKLDVRYRLAPVGWLNPAELPRRLATCFAAAVPLEDCFYNRYVTSPMKLFDYARSNVVPVVPRLPVFDELFYATGGAVFVEPGDAAGYAAALRELYENHPWRGEKEIRLASFAQQNTWQKRGARLLPFFESLLSLPPRRRKKPA